MALDNAVNFAKVVVSTGYSSGATSIVLNSGQGAKLPTAPFNLVWWNSTDYADPSDDPNVEVVRCTAIATDTLTVTRAQESTSASSKNTSGKTYKMIAGLTAKVINTDLSALILATLAAITDTAANIDLSMTNSTAATSSVVQNSPLFKLGGTYWTGAGASATDYWTCQAVYSLPATLSGTTAITQIAESAGNVVTLTLAAQSTFSQVGMSVYLSGFPTGKGDWLNGQTGIISAVGLTSMQFIDPTSHGTLSVVALTGTPVVTQASGMSLLTFANNGADGGLGLVNSTAATSTAVGYSPEFALKATYWNGASATETLTHRLIPLTGSNPVINSTWTSTGSTGGTSFIFNDASLPTASGGNSAALWIQGGGSNKIGLSWSQNTQNQINAASGSLVLITGGFQTNRGALIFQPQNSLNPGQNNTATYYANFFTNSGNQAWLWGPSTGSETMIDVGIVTAINSTVTAQSTTVTSATISSATAAALTVSSISGFINGGNTNITISGLVNANNTQLNGTWVISSVSGTTINITGSGWTTHAASGGESGTAKQVGGNWTNFLINSTETALYGTHKFIDCQLAGTSKFSIDNAGIMTAQTVVEAATLSPTSAATAGVTGQIAWDSGKIYVCTAGGSAGSATWKAATLTSV